MLVLLLLRVLVGVDCVRVAVLVCLGLINSLFNFMVDFGAVVLLLIGFVVGYGGGFCCWIFGLVVGLIVVVYGVLFVVDAVCCCLCCGFRRF